MDNGGKYTVLENMVYSFAAQQFSLNDVPDGIAVLIVKGVLNKFMDKQMNSILMDHVQFAPDDNVADALNKVYAEKEDMEDGNSDETRSLR